jgi:hypothetical protein
MAKTRRIKAFEFTPAAIVDLITGVTQFVPLPEGVEVIRYAVKWETNSAILFLTHEDWPEVDPGTVIELSNIWMERRT